MFTLRKSRLPNPEKLGNLGNKQVSTILDMLVQRCKSSGDVDMLTGAYEVLYEFVESYEETTPNPTTTLIEELFSYSRN